MTSVVAPTGNDDIDGILWGWKFDSSNLSFSFPTTGGTAEYPDYEAINGFDPFNATQQTAVRAILGNIASFTNLTFTETTAAGAVMQYAGATSINYTDDATVAGKTGLFTLGTAVGSPPELAYDGNPPFAPTYSQGDTWYNATGYDNPTLGSFQYAAGVMHETGHALGLKHGHVTQDGHGITFPMLPADHDSYEYSVMTYSQFPGDTTSGDNAPDHPTTYMQNDIAALQYLYGANYGASANNGNTTYTWSTSTGEAFIDGVGQGTPDSNFVLMTIWDGGGTDTYNLSNYTTDLSIDLSPGEWVILDTSSAQAQRANLGSGGGISNYMARGNIANALIDPNNPGETASLIENAIGGSGDDVMSGNGIANVFTGGAGDDTVDGKGGLDTVIFSGARFDYATSNPGGVVRIEDQRAGAPDGTDNISNVEFFQFSNRTYSLAEVLNQPPVLSPDPDSPHGLTELPGISGSLTADTVSGELAFSDEGGDTHTAGASLFSISWSDGAAVPLATQTALTSAMSAVIGIEAAAGRLDWQFSLADKNVDFLAVGETLTATYDITVTDQLDQSSTVPVTIVFTGTNDAPVVDGGSSTLAQSISELPGVTGSSAVDSAVGEIAFSDPDLNDRPTATIGSQSVTWQDLTDDYTSELTAAQMAALMAALLITPDSGNTNSGLIDWNFDIVDDQLDFLAVGESLTVTSQIVIDDHHGATTEPDVVVTVYGANDAPIAVHDSNGTAKNSSLSVAAGDGVIKNDSDPDIHDNDDLFVSEVDGVAASVGNAVAGSYGALTLNADGSYVYAANKGPLPAKFVAQDSFEYTLADGHGGTDTAYLNVVVFNPGTDYQAGMDTILIGGNGPDVLDGSAGGNMLFGGNGPDVLIGGDGNMLVGGNGPDIFLFNPDFGGNIVLDFDVHNDALQFDEMSFADVADILDSTVDTVAGAVITDPFGNTVTLFDVSLAELTAHDDLIVV